MRVTGFVIQQSPLLDRVFDRRQIDHAGANRLDGIRGQLERVQCHARVSVGALDQVPQRGGIQLELPTAQAALHIVQRPPHDELDLRVAQRAQREHAYAREQRRVHFERGILGGGADQCHRAVLGVRQHRVLLCLVPAVDLVDEQDGPLVGHAPRFLDDLAQVGHAGRHR